MRNNDTNMYRIQHSSSKFRMLLSNLIILVPVATLLYWLFFNSLPVGFKSELPVAVKSELPPITLLLGLLVSLIPLSPALYGAVSLRRLFGLYEKGIVFSEQNVNCFRHIGYALLFSVAANFVFTFLISIVLSFANPPGERLMVARFGSSDIGTLLIGAVVLLVSWVMKEAVAIEDERAHTV